MSDKFKALADPNRSAVFALLSCCELCACDILKQLPIHQTTLSHHMKVLVDCGLVRTRRDGKCIYYALNIDTVRDCEAFFTAALTKACHCGPDCSCLHCCNLSRKETAQ
ncbi:MAG: metalloregulator ArsR/SmtB family transcription factor [Oscillospiraceae bacterium]|nr:metalloregulator ArsR/SmtB family transcription factor [Oscillospiraceae bacterium]